MTFFGVREEVCYPFEGPAYRIKVSLNDNDEAFPGGITYPVEWFDGKGAPNEEETWNILKGAVRKLTYALEILELDQ